MTFTGATMSVHVFFSFSSGLSQPMKVPKGTFAEAMKRVADVEKALGLKTEQYRDNPPHWTRNDFKDISDEVLCREAKTHNRWIHWLYEQLGEWSKEPPAGKTEYLTPAAAAQFWHGLEEIQVPPERWDRHYYREEMEHLYEVMRRGEHDGRTFDTKPLTIEQADAVICMFAEYLDTHDIRLAVPVGHDHLASSYDGEYDWCSTCGAVATDEAVEHAFACKKRGCDLKKELKANGEL